MSPAARRRATRLLARLSRGAGRVVVLPRTRALLALLQEEGYHVGAVTITLHLLEPERSGKSRELLPLVANLQWPTLGIDSAMPVRVLPAKAPRKARAKARRKP